MQKSQLDTVIVGPEESPAATVIWMHGLGADGYDFADIVPQLQLPEDIKFIFPHAPVRPVTLNAGMKMRAWFDVYELGENAKLDEEGIYAAQQLIDELIDYEIAAGVPSGKIVLAGFSQGAAMALHCGLRYSKKLAGILALSGFLLLADRAADEINKANKRIPILMMHGTVDDIVPLKFGQRSRELLHNFGFEVEWHEYPMPHTVCPEEIQQVSTWLQNILGL